MRSAFFELNVATTGLFSSRGGLEVVSHNVANSQTKGYSRQYIEQRASWPLTYNNNKGMIGTGSEIYGVAQSRDSYLDKKYWNENGVLGEYSAKSDQLNTVEKIFAELSETGNTGGINLFFQSLQELSVNAGDDTYRTNVVQAGQGLCKFINNTAQSIKKQQIDANEEVKTVVQTINSIGQQIRSLNEQITKFEIDGSRANDLRDSRGRLVDELSKYVNCEVSEIERNVAYGSGKYPEPEDRGKSQKQFNVMINGYELVSNIDINQLKTVQRLEKANPMDAPGLYDIYFEGSNQAFDIYDQELKGELKGLVDVRDGNNASSFTASTPTITNMGLVSDITLENPSRTDLQQTGYIEIKAPNGDRKSVRYDGFTYDNSTTPTTATFKVQTSSLPVFAASPGVLYTSGKTSDYKGIPHYMDKLNGLVRTMAKAFNEGQNAKGDVIPDVTGHVYGYDAKGDNTQSLFFSYDIDFMGNKGPTNGAVSDYNDFNCENFMVNEALQENPSLLAAAVKATDGVSANDVIKGFLAIKHYNGLFDEGKAQDYVTAIAGELGIDVNQSKKFSRNYADVTASIENQRLSMSGVDINEEMIHMMKYQQVYHAAAKLVNVIDGIYDTTINKMGV